MTTATTTTSAPARRRREHVAPERRTVERRRIDGSVVDEIVLDPSIFGIEPNAAVLHQVVTAQLAAARAGTHSTLRRREVRGGGAKPYRQKGTGRARHGSIRAPQWEGGGVAFGPKPRSHRQRTPKKMIRLAMYSALSDCAAEGRVALVDEWTFEAPRTKDAVAALDALGLGGRVLVVLGPEDGIPDRSFANLPDVQTLQVAELNAYDVVRSEWIVFTDATLPGETEVVSTKAPAARARAGTAKKARSEAPRKARPKAGAKAGDEDEDREGEEPSSAGEPEAGGEAGREEEPATRRRTRAKKAPSARGAEDGGPDAGEAPDDDAAGGPGEGSAR